MLFKREKSANLFESMQDRSLAVVSESDFKIRRYFFSYEGFELL